MKKILFLLAIAAALVACKKHDDGYVARPIYIKGQETALKSASERMSVRDILRFKDGIHLWGGNGKYESFGSSFYTYAKSDSEDRIDTANNRLIFDSRAVIDVGGVMNENGGIFLIARNYVLTLNNNPDGGIGDTVGYIPNAVIREGQKHILELWREGDIETIYRDFQELFYFTPCTAEEFKQIREEIDWEHEYDDLKPLGLDTVHRIKWFD